MPGGCDHFYDRGVSDPAGGLPRRTVPLRQRRFDWVLLAFFAVNLCFITYFVDIEIRVPALVWSGSMSAVVLVILSEEYSGVYRSPHFGMVLLLNLPWLALPAATIARMSRAHPFTKPAPLAAGALDPAAGAAGAAPA